MLIATVPRPRKGGFRWRMLSHPEFGVVFVIRVHLAICTAGRDGIASYPVVEEIKEEEQVTTTTTGMMTMDDGGGGGSDF